MAGAVNGLILASETPNEAFFDSKYGNQTIEDRWLRLDGIKQYDAPPVDPNTQEFDDGSSYVLNKNSKEVSFVIVSPEANKMLGKVEASVECRGMLASFPRAIRPPAVSISSCSIHRLSAVSPISRERLASPTE